MTEVMEIKRSNLILPEGVYELDKEEMTYVEGGGVWTTNYTELGTALWLCLGLSGSAAITTALFVRSAIKAVAQVTASFLKTLLTTCGAALGICQIIYGLVELAVACSALNSRGYYTVHDAYINVFGLKIPTGIWWIS